MPCVDALPSFVMVAANPSNVSSIRGNSPLPWHFQTWLPTQQTFRSSSGPMSSSVNVKPIHWLTSKRSHCSDCPQQQKMTSLSELRLLSDSSFDSACSEASCCTTRAVRQTFARAHHKITVLRAANMIFRSYLPYKSVRSSKLAMVSKQR